MKGRLELIGLLMQRRAKAQRRELDRNVDKVCDKGIDKVGRSENRLQGGEMLLGSRFL